MKALALFASALAFLLCIATFAGFAAGIWGDSRWATTALLTFAAACVVGGVAHVLWIEIEDHR